MNSRGALLHAKTSTQHTAGAMLWLAPSLVCTLILTSCASNTKSSAIAVNTVATPPWLVLRVGQHGYLRAGTKVDSTAFDAAMFWDRHFAAAKAVEYAKVDSIVSIDAVSYKYPETILQIEPLRGGWKGFVPLRTVVPIVPQGTVLVAIASIGHSDVMVRRTPTATLALQSSDFLIRDGSTVHAVKQGPRPGLAEVTVDVASSQSGAHVGWMSLESLGLADAPQCHRLSVATIAGQTSQFDWISPTNLELATDKESIAELELADVTSALSTLDLCRLSKYDVRARDLFLTASINLDSLRIEVNKDIYHSYSVAERKSLLDAIFRGWISVHHAYEERVQPQTDLWADEVILVDRRLRALDSQKQLMIH